MTGRERSHLSPAAWTRATLCGCLLASHAPGVLAQAETDTFEACVLDLIRNSASDVTIGQVRETCQAAQAPVAPAAAQAVPEVPESAIDRRLAMEGATEVVPFVMTPHKPNYIIYTYNFQSYQDPHAGQPAADRNSDKPSEVDFQVSIKFPVWRNMFNTRTHLFAAYTNRSFWQVFDHNNSSPFRETDHEPELWLSHRTKWQLFGLTNRLVQAGIVHQSNGQSGDLSRSWNRVYANLIFERGHFYFGVKPWLRIQEDKKNDDNPDIEDYLGYFEFQGIYNRNKHNLGLLVRNTLKEDYRGAVQLDWGFPVSEHVRGYVQYFYGYGESLIDYDNKVNKLGIGIKLTDWL
jgi:phospholipase A1